MRRDCDDLDNGSGPNKQPRMDGCSPLGGPSPQHPGVNMYLPPTPFQEKLIANNPFDDSHNASAHLKGNLAKNFPPGKGETPQFSCPEDCTQGLGQEHSIPRHDADRVDVSRNGN